jgi:hypothetical protein
MHVFSIAHLFLSRLGMVSCATAQNTLGPVRGQIECILAVRVHVGAARRRYVRQRFGSDFLTSAFIAPRPPDIECVPAHLRIRHEHLATGLVCLHLPLPFAQLTLLRKVQELPQRMQRLAFVQLRFNPPPK